MIEELVAKLRRIGTLAEPARRDLYLYVVAQAEPVGRDQAAAATGLARHVVKFHLDRLVEEGMLDVEFRRLSGRRGPGAGRPAKLYRRAAQEISVSLPERRYELAGRIFADAIRGNATTGEPIAIAVARAAAAAARRVGDEVRADAGGGAVSPSAILASCGYEPRTEGNQIILANCPFGTLAQHDRELVCGMNLEFVTTMTRALDLDGIEIALNPGADRCCVTLHHRSAMDT